MGRTLQRYKRLFDELKKNSLHRIYFLYGPEEFLKKEFMAELIKSRLPELNRAFNLDVFHGDEFDRDVFADRLSSFPLFTERRVVVLRNFDGLSTSNQDFVLERIPQAADSAVLVVESQGAKLETVRLKKLQQVADERGLSFCFQHLSDDETIERVKTRFQREGFTVSPDALELLVDSVGTHLIDLANEVEKIILSGDPAKPVDREAVAAVVGRYRTENLFGMLDRIGRGDVSDLMVRLHRVIDGGEEPVYILAMLIRRVIQLLHVRLLMDEDKTAAKSIGQSLGGMISPFQVSILMDQARRVDRESLEVYLGNLRWADIKLKSTAIDAGHVIDTALIASSQRKTLAPSAG
jgi:DNA polymerase-3 subunit delta